MTRIRNALASVRLNGVDGGRGSYDFVVDEPGQRLRTNQQAQRREKRIVKRLGGKARRRAMGREARAVAQAEADEAAS